jgi:xylan 1,4-beta-xylosidase
MVTSRREALALGLAGAGGLALPRRRAAAEANKPARRSAGPPASSAPWRAGIEGQRRADLGDGRYLNPIVSGDRPDPSILKDGEDYYATFSSFLHYPAVVVWHSRDLVNWSPVGPALKEPLGSVWALDIAKHDGRYFIYIPIFNAQAPDFRNPGIPCKIFVVHAPSMSGPWSEPVDLDIKGYIDPGHVVGEDGRRYLFLNGGARVALSEDGLRRDGPVEQVYGGWPIPEDWVVEAPALEGPKLLRKDGWFYLFSAEGGTAGPPTSHMVIVARARSINGPWENCPHNPIVHSRSKDEPWWSRGHATPVQGPAGDWWLAYHGYENGFRTLGRQMLLEPISWTKDDWPRARGGDLGLPLAKPCGAAPGQHGIALSGGFSSADMGTRCAFYGPEAGYLDRARFEGGSLVLRGQGTGPADSSPLAFIVGDLSYAFTVDVALDEGAQAGLLLFYDDTLFCGVGASPDVLHAYKLGKPQNYPPPGPAVGPRLSLRVINDENVASFFIRSGSQPWRRIVSYEVSGYNHNMADGFMSLRPAIFASGTGRARFGAVEFEARGSGA